MTDKDAIIQNLMEQNALLHEHIRQLEEKIARLEKNSANSSKPIFAHWTNKCYPEFL